MRMTRQHFTLIAEVLREHGPVSTRDRNYLITRMADALASTNPSFDRYRFYNACGWKD